jgi:hypothetical protein
MASRTRIQASRGTSHRAPVSRRGLLFGAGAALGVLAANRAAANALLAGQDATLPPPETSISMAPNQNLAVDLSAQLASFSDVGNEVQVSVVGPAGAFLANVHNLQALAGGQSGLFNRRELADFFWLQTTGAKPGDAYALVLQGHTGPNGTGSVETKNLAIKVVPHLAPAAWDIGAQTLALCGGMDLCAMYGGNAGDWKLTAQTNAHQFTLLRDATANTCRIVLRGATDTPADYGSTARKVAPADGGKAGVTVANAALGLTRPIAYTFVANRADIAPMPNAATTLESGATTTTTADTTTTQIGQQAARFLSGGTNTTMGFLNRGMTGLCEDGVYPVLDTAFCNGRDVGTGPDAFYFGGGVGDAYGKGVPTGGAPFVDGWDYNHTSRVPVIHPGYVTLRSRNPWAAKFASISISVAALSYNAHPVEAGLRVSGIYCMGSLSLTSGGGRYGRTSACNATMADHCYIGGGGSTFGTYYILQLDPIPKGNHLIANKFVGSSQPGTTLSIWSADALIVGNDFNRTASSNNAGVNNDLINYALWDSDVAHPKTLFGFNFLRKAGVIGPNQAHQDYNQAFNEKPGNIWWHPGNRYNWALLLGNVIWGAPYAIDANGNPVSGGQMFFAGDPTQNNSLFTQNIIANIGCEVGGYALGINGTADQSYYNRNTFIGDRSIPAGALPRMRINSIAGMLVGSITGNVLTTASAHLSGQGPGWLQPGDPASPTTKPNYVIWSSDRTRIPGGTYLSAQTSTTSPFTYTLVTGDGSIINTSATTTLMFVSCDDRGWHAHAYRNLSSAADFWTQPIGSYMVWQTAQNIFGMDDKTPRGGMAKVLTAPYAGAAVQNYADAIRACTPKVGAANYDWGAVNPHIDHRRRTWDLAALKAA